MNVKLKNLRLSYPALFKAKAYEEGKEPSFSANFIFDPKTDQAQIKALKDAINKVAKEKWPDKLPKMKGICLKTSEADGDGEYPDGYGEGIQFVTAGSKKRVPIVDRDPSVVLAEEDGRPYAGCYVNVSIRLWAQDNKYGCRINAQLLAVQFAKDGQPFGEKPVDPENEFEKLPEEEGAVEETQSNDSLV